MQFTPDTTPTELIGSITMRGGEPVLARGAVFTKSVVVEAISAGIQVTPIPVVHGNSGGPFFGYRIEVENRIIAFSGDTEWTDTLIEVGRDADLFVIECYAYDKPIRNHLNLKTIEQNLARINPKKLVLTHMSPDMLAHCHEVAHLTASDGMVVAL